jgi:putative membrane protein
MVSENTTVYRPTSLREYLLLYLKGFMMGSADVVPGVSGGTVAFVVGIYETLIDAINAVNLKFVRRLARLQWRAAFADFPWHFLLILGLGIGTAILTMAHVLSWALEHHQTLVWGFFFGLIVASTVLVLKRVRRWTLSTVAVLIGFTIGMVLLVGLTPHEMPHTPIFLFFSGALAICAMILPGISGAFILVLLGQYHYVLEAVVNRDWLTLLLVGAGCAVGLLLFARVLKWLFSRYHDLTVAALIGLMIGSLRKIWPWKLTTLTEVELDGSVIPLVQHNVLPDRLSPDVLLVIGLAVVGLLFVLGMETLAERGQARREVRSRVTHEVAEV